MCGIGQKCAYIAENSNTEKGEEKHMKSKIKDCIACRKAIYKEKEGAKNE